MDNELFLFLGMNNLKDKNILAFRGCPKCHCVWTHDDSFWCEIGGGAFKPEFQEVCGKCRDANEIKKGEAV